MVLAGHQCVYSPLSSSRTPYQHANTRHSEQQTRLGDAPDLSTVAPGDYLDHRPPSSRVLSILHADPRRWLPNGYPELDCSIPRRIQWQRPRHLRIRVYTQPERHTLSPMDPCRTSPRPWMTGQLTGNGSKSLAGNLSPSTTKNGRPTSSNGVGFGSPTSAFKSGLQTLEAQLAAFAA